MKIALPGSGGECGAAGLSTGTSARTGGSHQKTAKSNNLYLFPSRLILPECVMKPF